MSESGKYSILYVDDEWTNRTVFEQNFDERFRIVSVASGAEALEILAAQTIACLVTDQRMPGMSGNELLQRAKERHPDTIRVVVTAYSDLDPILKAVNDGLVARYIVKPWVKEELEKILAWAVGAFALGRESSEVQQRILKSERLIALGGMAGGIIHEIRNLISPPKANAQYLLDPAKHAKELGRLVHEHGAGLSPEARASLADLAVELPALSRDSAENIGKIDDILKSYRDVLAGNQPEERHRADPSRAIGHALNLLRTMSKAVTVAVEAPERLPSVAIGQTELSQVLINLGRNAIQAFPPQTRGRVVLSAREDGDVVHFAITDDGPGIPPETLARVGSEFFTTKADGTGLGVGQCKRLIGKAGGELRIESTVGKGTTVRFSLRKSPSPVV